ncbi:hypothetical protein, partial [Proteiniclasticum sp.]|uniref:hypothetical protein n=1 Tax=Proteiniclasticum sp. TaxID=2053595 RepID=UPI002897CA61
MKMTKLISDAPELTKIKAKKLMKENSIGKITYRKNLLQARTEDGMDYIQKILLEDQEVKSYSCSCNREEILCPHLLALLMKWAEKPIKEVTVDKTPKATLKNTKSNLKEILDGADK